MSGYIDKSLGEQLSSLWRIVIHHQDVSLWRMNSSFQHTPFYNALLETL